jgi:anoctamin-10
MALANNFLELRSDAFKITVHNRRPIPTRTDTIGPWLDALTFLTWLAALTNSALVYLFNPSLQAKGESHHYHHHYHHPSSSGNGNKALLVTATLIALASSHGYLLMRAVVRHVVERVVWKGSREVEEKEKSELEVKQAYLKSLERVGPGGLGDGVGLLGDGDEEGEEDKAFWDFDEGLDEIRRTLKEA